MDHLAAKPQASPGPRLWPVHPTPRVFSEATGLPLGKAIPQLLPSSCRDLPSLGTARTRIQSGYGEAPAWSTWWQIQRYRPMGLQPSHQGLSCCSGSHAKLRPVWREAQAPSSSQSSCGLYLPQHFQLVACLSAPSSNTSRLPHSAGLQVARAAQGLWKDTCKSPPGLPHRATSH